MLTKEFWGILFIVFVGWMLVASSPDLRIERGCRPVGWTGNVVVSLSSLVVPDHQVRVKGWFDKLEYGCRYSAWRLIYQEDFNKWQAAQKAEADKANSLAQELEPGKAPRTPEEALKADSEESAQ